AQAHPLERHFAMLAVAEDRGRVGDDHDAKGFHAGPGPATAGPASRSGESMIRPFASTRPRSECSDQAPVDEREGSGLEAGRFAAQIGGERGELLGLAEPASRNGADAFGAHLVEIARVALRARS